MSSPGTPALETRSLAVGYGAAPIVKGASVSVSSGSVAVLVGPNGSGKSTLLKGIAGVRPPLSGTVILDGEPPVEITGMRPEKASALGLGYVPQVENVFLSLTVRENLQLGAYTSRRTMREKFDYVYSLFPDLHTAARKPARALSGGQRGMLALARALMASPKVLLVDEPTAGLSPKFQAVVWEQLLKLRDENVAILVVEQNTRAALESGDTGYVLVTGEIKRAGSCKDLLGDDQLVDLYIGQHWTAR